MSKNLDVWRLAFAYSRLGSAVNLVTAHSSSCTAASSAASPAARMVAVIAAGSARPLVIAALWAIANRLSVFPTIAWVTAAMLPDTVHISQGLTPIEEGREDKVVFILRPDT